MTPPTDTQGAVEMVSDDFARGIEKLREVKAMLRQEERLEAMSRIGWAIEELLATRRDAARYRWLRERDVCFSYGQDIWRTRSELDTTIDSLLSAQSAMSRALASPPSNGDAK